MTRPHITFNNRPPHWHEPGTTHIDVPEASWSGGEAEGGRDTRSVRGQKPQILYRFVLHGSSFTLETWELLTVSTFNTSTGVREKSHHPQISKELF